MQFHDYYYFRCLIDQCRDLNVGNLSDWKLQAAKTIHNLCKIKIDF